MLGIKDHWYGKEVEGRFSDVETLFIGNAETKIDLNKIKVPHVYICAPAVSQTIEKEKWDTIFRMVDDYHKIVTLEVKPGMLEKIPPMIRIKCHILYMLEHKDVGLLTDNDSIKILHGDYNLYITSIQNMQTVTPDDYKFDRSSDE